MDLEFIGFKALRSAGGCLFSALRESEWGLGPHSEFRLEAAPGDLEAGHGVFAATWELAALYGDEIYAVVPYWLDEVDRVDFIEGNQGWRSSRAQVVAGPFEPQYGMPGDIAEAVLDLKARGYRQISGVLREARRAATISELQQGENLPHAQAFICRKLRKVKNAAIRRFVRGLVKTSPAVAWAVLVLTGEVCASPTTLDAEADILRSATASWPFPSRLALAAALIRNQRKVNLDSHLDLIGAVGMAFPDLRSNRSVLEALWDNLRIERVPWDEDLSPVGNWPEVRFMVEASDLEFAVRQAEVVQRRDPWRSLGAELAAQAARQLVDLAISFPDQASFLDPLAERLMAMVPEFPKDTRHWVPQNLARVARYQFAS